MASIVETAPLVLDVGAVLLVAATSGLLARKVGLPAIVGYLLTGLLVSPFTPGFVADSEQISILADIGVVLLLFEVGIEIDLRRIKKEQGAILWAAPLQVLVGTIFGTLVFIWMNLPLYGAALLALSIALSSSVVIVNITRSRRRTTSVATEEALLGWSVVQDIFGVTIAAFVIALLGSDGENPVISVLSLIGFIVLAIVASKLIPYLLRIIRWEHDLFLIYSVAIGLSIAALGTVVFGVPMALASFVAGLAINQSSDTNDVRKAVLPFRDLFQVFFFVVIGSLVQPDLILESLPFTVGILGVMFALKTIPAFLFARFGKIGDSHGQLAVGLSQVGEFSFVLGSTALAANALSKVQFNAILLAVIASIIVSTLAVRRASRISRSI
ncbi:KefB Kef-type K+ transport systems, membrane components [Candidatus Nanopelagicaceae bacterium]|jgi:CPA2 family monovalent cation:H+ antiporter-2